MCAVSKGGMVTGDRQTLALTAIDAVLVTGPLFSSLTRKLGMIRQLKFLLIASANPRHWWHWTAQQLLCERDVAQVP